MDGLIIMVKIYKDDRPYRQEKNGQKMVETNLDQSNTSFQDCLNASETSSIWLLFITKGEFNLMIFPLVGFAMTPRLSISFETLAARLFS